MKKEYRLILLMYIIGAICAFSNVTPQQSFVTQSCAEAEYLKDQMIYYGEKYELTPREITNIIRFSLNNDCPLDDMYYNDYISIKQYRQAKIVSQFIKADYNCKNKQEL